MCVCFTAKIMGKSMMHCGSPVVFHGKDKRIKKIPIIFHPNLNDRCQHINTISIRFEETCAKDTCSKSWKHSGKHCHIMRWSYVGSHWIRIWKLFGSTCRRGTSAKRLAGKCLWCVYACTHTHAHTNTYAHTHTHTHTQYTRNTHPRG